MRANTHTERVLRLHELMLRIRAFEEQGLKAHGAGLIHGPIHVSIGQEAVAAALGTNLRRDDLLISTHRGHGHTLAKGADSTAMMCELLGRADGPCRGKGGSVHLADFSVGMLGANGVIGANILIANGAAQAIRLKGDERIVVCMIGDGAINRGPFLEGLNWSRIFDLPVLFICEDNGFAASTRTATVTGGGGVLARVEALGISAREVDGNDVLALDDEVSEAVDRVRAGEGPRFLLAKTYRLHGHSASDPARYRSAEEVETAWQRDPIALSTGVLRRAGVDEAVLEGLQVAAKVEAAEALRVAMDASWPDPALAFDDVQDTGAPSRPKGRS